MVKPVESVTLDGIHGIVFALDGAEAVSDVTVSAASSSELAELNQLLQWGWQFLWNNDFVRARYWYGMFFAYYSRFGGWNEQMRSVYFTALIQYAWLLSLQGQKDSVDKLFNKQLHEYLKAFKSWHPGDTHAGTLIEGLQRQGKLPSKKQPVLMFQPEVTLSLSRQLAQMGQKQPALDLLQYVQSWQTLQQLETARQIEQLHSGQRQATPQKVIAHMPILQWLPYAPTQGPFPMEHRESQHVKYDLRDALTLDELEGMLAVNQNRQQQQQKKKKQ